MTGDGSLTAVDGEGPVVTFRLAKADGTVLAEYQPDRQFVPASTLKLAVLAAVAKELEAGGTTLAETMPAAHTWASKAGGEFGFDDDEVDTGMPPEGTLMTVSQVLERMITVSSNEATNMMMERVGLEAIAQVLADAGCPNSALGRLYGDLAAAREFGRVSYATAGDLANLMAAVVRGQFGGEQWSRYMTDLLARQQDVVIGGVVPEGVPWGSKSGWIPQIRHDAAYLGAPGPDCLVLGVCTEGFASYPAAVAAIRAVTRALLAGRELAPG